MKTNLLFFLVLVFFETLSGVQAQDYSYCSKQKDTPTCMQDQIQSKRIDFIVRQLALSPKDQASFLPIYHSYCQAIAKVSQEPFCEKKSTKKTSQDLLFASDKEADIYLDLYFRKLEERIAIQKQYADQFKRVLPVQKVAKLFLIEREFISTLIKESKMQCQCQKEK